MHLLVLDVITQAYQHSVRVHVGGIGGVAAPAPLDLLFPFRLTAACAFGPGTAYLQADKGIAFALVSEGHVRVVGARLHHEILFGMIINIKAAKFKIL